MKGSHLHRTLAGLHLDYYGPNRYSNISQSSGTITKGKKGWTMFWKNQTISKHNKNWHKKGAGRTISGLKKKPS